MLLGADATLQPLWQILWPFLPELTRVILWPSNPTAGCVPKRMETHVHTKTRIETFTALFVKVKKWKQRRCLPTAEWEWGLSGRHGFIRQMHACPQSSPGPEDGGVTIYQVGNCSQKILGKLAQETQLERVKLRLFHLISPLPYCSTQFLLKQTDEGQQSPNLLPGPTLGSADAQ